MSGTSGQWNRLLNGSVAPTQWQLTPTGEALYQQQTQDRAGDTQDYDLRGAWAQQGGGQFGEGHLTDYWKLPNHPTFSSGSRLSTAEQPGGNWVQMPGGQWAYMPSQTNYDQYGQSALEDYFRRVEPNSLLLQGNTK